MSNTSVDMKSFKKELEGFNQAQRVESLIIDSQRPNIIYSGSEYGLLTSKDSGQTWQEVAIVMPPESKPVLGLAIDPQNTDYLYYSAGSILYRSLDQGIHWTVHELDSNRKISKIVVSPHESGVVFVGIHE